MKGKASQALLERVSENPEEAAMLKKLAHVEQSLTDRPLTAGNAVTLLLDGPAAYDEMFDAIRTAKHHVHMETYILSDDEIGKRLTAALADARSNGVEVRLIYDGVGTLSTPEAFFENLAELGVKLYKYNPPDITEDIRIWRINQRHHRKILVVDGERAFTGGINIDDVYAESSFEPSTFGSSLGSEDGQGWRDTHIRIRGPAVADVQRIFINLWNEQDEEKRLQPTSDYYPSQAWEGDHIVRIIDSEGGDDEYDIYQVFYSALSHARERIWITQAYFVPGDEMIDALSKAAARGVDVRVLLPGFTDAPMVMYASRSYYSRLLKAGIRLYERNDTVIHAKTAVVDGVWSTVGSSNFDFRSFLHNNEANAVIMGSKFGDEMEDLFQVDLDHARELSLDEWQSRPVWEKVKEELSSIFEYWF